MKLGGRLIAGLCLTTGVACKGDLGSGGGGTDGGTDSTGGSTGSTTSVTTDASSDTAATDSGTGGTSTTAATGPGTDSAADTTSTITGGSSSGGSTGGPGIQCGDGIVVAGELCLPDTPELLAVDDGAVRLATGVIAGSHPDIVTINTNTVSVLVGDGTGAFAVSDDWGTAGNAARAIAVGDADADGDDDILVYSNALRIFHNDNGLTSSVDLGGFQAPAGQMHLAQIDGTGPLDVVYGEAYNTIVHLGGGAANAYSTTEVSTQVTGGDFHVAPVNLGFDGDDDMDVIIGYSFSISYTVARGDGMGAFSSYATIDPCPVCGGAPYPGVEAVHGVDLDGDAEPDIISSTEAGISVNVHEADTDWGTPTQHDILGTGDITSADLDADGAPDVLVASALNNGGAIQVLLGNGDGTLQDPMKLDVDEPTISVLVVDVNEDGAPDVLTAYSDANDVGQVALFLADP